MNPTTPNDVWGMAPEMPIVLFQGTVKKVWQPKIGAKDGKEWSMQAVIFESNKGELKATIWNAPECPRTWEGEVVSIESQKGPNNRWQGILTTDYKGQIQLKVSDKAKIQLASQKKEKDADDIPYDKPQMASPHEERREPRPQSSPDDAKSFLKKAANMMLMCLKTATDIRAEYSLNNGGEEMTPEQFQAVTSSLWIVCDRKGLISTMSEHERGEA